VALLALDAALVALSLYGAFSLRFNFYIEPLYYNQFLIALPAFIALRLLLFWSFNLYRGILRYASTSELIAIIFSTTLGSLVVSLVNSVAVPFIPAVSWLHAHEARVQRMSWPVVIIEWALTIILVGGFRFSRRILASGYFRRADVGDLRRVLIVGAGDAGEAVARQMSHSPVSAYKPVAFVDDAPGKQGRFIHGIPVAGTIPDIPAVIAKHEAEEVLIAIPGIGPAKLNEIVALCGNARVGFKILPSMADVFSGRVSINQIRPVEIEDLLEREQVRLELDAERNYLRGATVLITGAGGSIGSELCRQVIPLGAAKVVLFGHGENSIYEIATELNQTFGAERIVPVIGDIRDERKLRAAVERHRPAVFFHAAAHKHVPLMEFHPDEAVKNNVTGTLNVARAASDAGARNFILISSDKAVRPTNVMGASKRIAEMIVFCVAKDSATQFTAVRFGNVLGSRGSVIPLFKRQIARGGPVTLTHPEVTRFFMTIPEAVSLVIQAGSMNSQRRLYLLDMGKPVKIVDLARRLIQLSGFEPERDIEIQFTGLRPGEKLTEELLTAGENVKATGLGKIFITEPDDVDCAQLWRSVTELQKLADDGNDEGIRQLLRALVPDYKPESGGQR
jgi:FlaA1/EpsC-like NDP-sugar epimerase